MPISYKSTDPLKVLTRIGLTPHFFDGLKRLGIALSSEDSNTVILTSVINPEKHFKLAISEHTKTPLPNANECVDLRVHIIDGVSKLACDATGFSNYTKTQIALGKSCPASCIHFDHSLVTLTQTESMEEKLLHSGVVLGVHSTGLFFWNYVTHTLHHAILPKSSQHYLFSKSYTDTDIAGLEKSITHLDLSDATKVHPNTFGVLPWDSMPTSTSKSSANDSPLPASSFFNKPACSLVDAWRMYYPVQGTSIDSKPYCFIASDGGVKIAIRWNALNQGLAIRVAHSDGLANHHSKFENVGLDVKGEGHASIHLKCATIPEATKTAGAILADLGFNYTTPYPDIKKVIEMYRNQHFPGV